MPYASKSQQGLFHSPNSPVSKKVVAKFDSESKGSGGLPSHVHEKSESKRTESKESKNRKGPRATAFRAQVLRQADKGGP